jgi:hypothetical protein
LIPRVIAVQGLLSAVRFSSFNSTLVGSRSRKSIVHGISTLIALRDVLNCTLPVEVFHLGKDDPINDKDRASLFAISNVVIRDLTQYTINNEKAGMGGWDMKPFAIMASSFRHALMMVWQAFV